ncbi:MAG: hypothetical protein HYZ28_20425 [Myxococcales bacterium]|nr:hypothetical protein [Myxococcales bacterium]
MRREAALLSLLTAGAALAGERFSLADKVAQAEVVVEVRMRVKGGSAQLEKVERVLHPQGEAPKLPSKVFLFSRGSPCWKKAKAKGSVRALVFFAREQSGALRQLSGVEQEDGRTSELSPGYEKLSEAVTRAKGWVEERMRAVPAQMLWRDQRSALSSQDNPALAYLAAAFLRSKDSASVLDEEWGFAGTEARKAHEAFAQEPAGGCGR